MDSEDNYEVTHSTVIIPLVLIVFIASLVQIQRRQADLSHIPTIGPSSFPFYYIGAIRFFFNATWALQEGYHRSGLAAFKVAQLTRWIVVITGSELIEELRKLPEDALSYSDATIKADQLTLTGILTDPSHVALLSTQLTRTLPLVFPELRDEMVAAFSDAILKEPTSEWTAVSAVNGMTEIISRVCNRVIVGPQTCREPEFSALNKQFIRDKTKYLGILPTPQYIGLRAHAKRIRQLLDFKVKRRRQKLESSDSEHRHDLLSLLVAKSSGPHASRDITHSILALNLQAVPTTSLTFTHALYHLASASSSDVVQPMRDEIEAVLRQEGWTLNALERMRKVDSFLKESMRISGLHALTMQCISRTDYTFSDGTHVPARTHLAVACGPMHLDPAKYTSPQTFDATRFVRGSGEGASRYQLATTTADFLAWGHGRAGCPGRFFAAVLMKLMLAHMVLQYDVRFGDGAGGARPRDCWVGPERFPDLSAEVMFRRRR
ncbi:hypothetical protein D9615_001366 [Tricholomella constricta]|uniref:Cytochrome P450 n=1 Tax=Tricholomella constricta TaxID=117010 RepID=A0A8H5HKR1_9AGAR|nr:hypothetical protein D9615_001366 [Tricholomella constricta]